MVACLRFRSHANHSLRSLSNRERLLVLIFIILFLTLFLFLINIRLLVIITPWSDVPSGVAAQAFLFRRRERSEDAAVGYAAFSWTAVVDAAQLRREPS